ncbi:dihydropteroate synthase [Magnetospira sp. QH-2]|uniref:dihydropteroate synthase n=1 Tax=Magnetospira sp. (strain QH-2) TaxID=1288970 RepID=UPI0003E80AF5|nr:dihydropteroate synthase [Magnetospira sp. QH-2]CCQ73322.1 7,8-dihydropteroate synthase [Magnetospira sp. QH-2]
MIREFAGFQLDEPVIMGIVNVTPDSFSDGGDHPTPETAIAHGRRLRAEGAHILDIGGESTRPGSAPVPEEEELRRVIPVIEALMEDGAVISIDTRHARVMEEAVKAGAEIINDVTALTGDPDSLATAARLEVPVVLMHMQGEPQTMQAHPHYDDVVAEVGRYLAERVAACRSVGILPSNICIDPGIGFGKTVDHNLALIRHLEQLRVDDCALMLGLSRKSFIGALSRNETPKDRLPGSLAGALAGLDNGAEILRVHDVVETRQALAVWHALHG